MFKFLHTADWHIGKTYGGFSEGKRGVLKRARLAAIDRIGEAAKLHGTAHVIVCGDIFDSPGLPDQDLLAVRGKLNDHPDVIWHLLPGNHDPAQRDGVWERVVRLGLPRNVNLLLESEPTEVESGVWLLPAPLASKAMSGDPTEWMDRAITPAGALRVGVAHGSVQGFGSERGPSIAISPDRANKARLDYLALGDWHGQRQIAPRVWYPGTPEPDQYLDNHPGYALLVTLLAAGAEPVVEPVATASLTWIKRALRLSGLPDLKIIEDEIDRLGRAKDMSLVEVELSGTLTLADDAAVDGRLKALGAQLFHLNVRRDGLVIDAGGEDLDSIGDPQVRHVAERLLAMRGDSAGGRIAEGALRRLFTLVRIARESVR